MAHTVSQPIREIDVSSWTNPSAVQEEVARRHLWGTFLLRGSPAGGSSGHSSESHSDEECISFWDRSDLLSPSVKLIYGNTTFPFGLHFCSLDDASFACWMSAFLPVIGTWGHGDICSVYSPTLLMSPVWFWVQCFIWLLPLSCWAVTYFILTSVGIVHYALIEFSLIFVPYVNTWKIILYLNQSAPNSFFLSIYNYFPFLLIFFPVSMNLENLSDEW